MYNLFYRWPEFRRSISKSFLCISDGHKGDFKIYNLLLLPIRLILFIDQFSHNWVTVNPEKSRNLKYK